MTKISEPIIRTRDFGIREHISTIVSLWNLGKIGFSFTSVAPTDEPSDYEIRIFSSGATFRIYVYFVGTGWKFFDADG